MWYVIQQDPDTKAIETKSKHRTRDGANRSWKKHRQQLQDGYGRYLPGLRVWDQAQMQAHQRGQLDELGQRLRGEDGAAAAWLRSARAARGWTQMQLAERLQPVVGGKIDALLAQVGRWEQGGARPLPATLVVLRQVLES